MRPSPPPRPGSVLRAGFSFPTGILTTDEVTALAQLWRQALDRAHRTLHHSRRWRPDPLGSGPGPPDQETINGLEHRFPTLTDVWPLSPLQAGLAFHGLLAEQSIDAYTVQLALQLRGEVHPQRMQVAAQALLDRHANLRAAFTQTGEGQPVQVVPDHAEIPFTVVDLTHLDEGSRDTELDLILDMDRTARFDLAAPPLLRLLLVTTAPGEHRLVLTNHHILLDGWSMPLLLQELLALYATAGDTTPLPRIHPHRDYLTWLSRQDTHASRTAWAQALSGLDEPTLLTPDEPGRQLSTIPHETHLELTEQQTIALTALAQQRELTLNTMVQTAWGILLATVTGRDDVSFGATVSGRPAHLSGIESMIGLFINTLPVRITLNHHDTLGGLLDRIQTEQTALLDHHYLGLTEIKHVTGPAATFDTLTVFESYPIDRAALVEATDIAGRSA